MRSLWYAARARSSFAVKSAARLLVAVTLIPAFILPTITYAENGRGKDYLALGDSVAFGYNPLVDPSNPDNFVGYPSTVAQLADENVTNASCLGETSGSFISPTGTDNGCVCSAPFFHSTSRTAERSSTLPISFLLSHPRTAW